MLPQMIAALGDPAASGEEDRSFFFLTGNEKLPSGRPGSKLSSSRPTRKFQVVDPHNTFEFSTQIRIVRMIPSSEADC